MQYKNDLVIKKNSFIACFTSLQQNVYENHNIDNKRSTVMSYTALLKRDLKINFTRAISALRCMQVDKLKIIFVTNTLNIDSNKYRSASSHDIRSRVWFKKDGYEVLIASDVEFFQDLGRYKDIHNCIFIFQDYK